MRGALLKKDWTASLNRQLKKRLNYHCVTIRRFKLELELTIESRIPTI